MVKFNRKLLYVAAASLPFLEIAVYYAATRLDLRPRNWFTIYLTIAGAMLLAFGGSRLAPVRREIPPIPTLEIIPREGWDGLFFACSIVFLMSLAISPIVLVALMTRFKEASVRAWLPLGGIAAGLIAGGISWSLLRKELQRWTDILSVFGTMVGIFGGIGAAIAFLYP